MLHHHEDWVIQCTNLKNLLMSPYSDFRCCVVSPGECKVSLNVDNIHFVIGDAASSMVRDIKNHMIEKVQAQVSAPLLEAGSILSWLTPVDLPKYTEIHCDKANNYDYDVSALLYLSTQGEDFGGGELVILDETMSFSISPSCGDLVVFTSGIENIHKVERVTAGNRFVISVWYQFSSDRKEGQAIRGSL
jgi:hypothetical protein